MRPTPLRALQLNSLKKTMGIALKEVLNKVKTGQPFSISYRKKNGTFGSKNNVRSRVEAKEGNTAKSLGSIANEVKNAGQLFLLDEFDRPFDLYICLIVRFNGQLIDHQK